MAIRERPLSTKSDENGSSGRTKMDGKICESIRGWSTSSNYLSRDNFHFGNG